MQGRYKLTALVVTFALVAGANTVVQADRYSSTSYLIDASVMSAAGGSQTSTSYKLVSSTGENVIGNGAAGSYKMGIGYVAQLEKALSLTVQQNGLVGYWPFNEPSGTFAYDSTPNGQSLTLSNQTFLAGKLSNAIQFDATTAVAVTTTSTTLNFQSSDFTVQFWYKPSSVTGNRDILRKGTLASNGFAVGMVGAAPTMYTGSATNYRACSNVTAGAWVHLAFVKQGTSLNCYKDGLLANGATGGSIPANIGSASAQFTIGGGGQHSTGPAGDLDNLKLFSIALTADDIKATHAAENTGTPAGLSLGGITPGVSKTMQADIITQTDSGGYSLAISQDRDLTSGVYTIPAVSGSIASPLAWSEGTTKGLGFTLTATNATAIPGTWNSGNSYAAFPGSATTFYARTGTAATKDYLTMRLRADVATSQPATGSTPYTNTITVTGTMTP